MDTFNHPLRERIGIITNYDYFYENLPNTTIDQRFRIQYKPATREIRPWRQEVIETARRIHAAAEGRPLVLGMSGGIDSEVAARAFTEAGIPYTGLSLRYVADYRGFNDHDVAYAKKYCADHGVKHIVVEVNIEEFFKKKAEEYFEQGYRAVNLFRVTQLMVQELAESRGACSVMAGGEQLYVTENNDETGEPEIYIKSNPDFSVPLQWCFDRGVRHFPYFFRQNPEVFAAYQRIDMIETMLRDPRYFVNTLHTTSLEKMMVYHANFPDMQRRKKFHGFEKFIVMRKRIQGRLIERFPDLYEPIRIPIRQIRQQIGF